MDSLEANAQNRLAFLPRTRRSSMDVLPGVNVISYHFHIGARMNITRWPGRALLAAQAVFFLCLLFFIDKEDEAGDDRDAY